MNASTADERGGPLVASARRAGRVVLGTVWVAALALACSNEGSTRYSFPNPICLDFPWDALSVVPGETPPGLPCQNTLDCPPPLTCQPRPGSSAGACVLLRDAPNPSAPTEVYEVTEFLLSITEGDDYNLIEFNGLPSAASVLRCVFHICPPDADVLRGAPDRCRYADRLVNLGLTGGLALPLVATGPDRLDVEAPIPACGTNPETGQRSLRPFRVAAVGFFAICYAFSETDLVAVSAIVNLSRSEVGSSGQDAYQTGCAGGDAREGSACVYTRANGVEDLGVCVGRACCAPCWTNEDCGAFQGDTCAGIQALSEPTDGRTIPAISGFCTDVACVDRNGIEQCTLPRPLEDVPDAGVDSDMFVEIDSVTNSVWVTEKAPAEGCDSLLDDGGMRVTGDGGMGQMGDGGMGQMGDAAPPPDMRPALDAGPRPDAGPPDLDAGVDMAPPEMELDAMVPDRMPPRMP